MIQGPMLDVAIGVLMVFLVTSLLASAIVETVGGFFHRRSKNLWDTIDLMLGEAKKEDRDDASKLVDLIYRQPFVTKLVQPKAQRFYPDTAGATVAARDVRAVKPGLDPAERKRRFHGPQHIEPRAFAKAFIEAIEPGGNIDADVVKLKAAVERLPGPVRTTVGSVLAEAGDRFVDARDAIADWYETHMGAVSTWYRRQTRYFLFAAGLAIAIVGNIDAVVTARTLYRDEAVREAVVAQAEAITQAECSEQEGSEAQLDCLRDEVGGTVGLPIGWSDLDGSLGAWGLRILGWVVVAGAVTLGAPFWFDLLGRALAHRKRSKE